MLSTVQIMESEYCSGVQIMQNVTSLIPSAQIAYLLDGNLKSLTTKRLQGRFQSSPLARSSSSGEKQTLLSKVSGNHGNSDEGSNLAEAM